jgi:hypothetical protein
MSLVRHLPLLLATLLPLGCGKVQSTINPSDANLFNEEWKTLAAEGAKSTHPAEAPSDATLLLFEGLEGIEDMLKAGPLGKIASQEPPTSRAALGEWLESLAPLFKGISAMLNQDPIQAAIQSGKSLAQRPSIRLELDPLDRYAAPALKRVLRLVRPLCAGAVYCATERQNSDACIRKLVQALDLIHLLDDGSLASLGRSSQLSSEVLDALQKLLPHPGVTPDFLRAQVEPRLALASTPGRLGLAVEAETIYRMAIGRGLTLTPDKPGNAFGLKYLDCKPEEAIERCLEFLAINRSMRLQANLCNLIAQEGTRGNMTREVQALDDYHEYEIASHLARTALALNEYHWLKGHWPDFLNELEGFAGDQPSSPCNARRVDYERGFNGMSLTSFDRSSRKKQTEVDLHRWTWTKEDIKNLNARR